MDNIFKPTSNSRMEMEEVYCWTTTVKDWKHLLKQDKYKLLQLNLLRNMVEKKQIAVYGFVIMPNHIHLIWELLKMNEKEKPHASFQKASSHEIVKDIKINQPQVLPQIKTTDNNMWGFNLVGVKGN